MMKLMLGVALLHSLTMLVSGGALAFGVYRWLGLRFLSKGWFNLDLAWALSLTLVGGVALIWAIRQAPDSTARAVDGAGYRRLRE